MKLEIEFPDELVARLEPLAAFYRLPLPDTVASLAIFQMCCSGIAFRQREWSEPFAFETLVLPWGVRVTMNREVEREHADAG